MRGFPKTGVQPKGPTQDPLTNKTLARPVSGAYLGGGRWLALIRVFPFTVSGCRGLEFVGVFSLVESLWLGPWVMVPGLGSRIMALSSHGSDRAFVFSRGRRVIRITIFVHLW